MVDSVIQEAQDFFRASTEADSDNRAKALEDLRFRWGDQWPTQIQNSRMLESRPMLTINEMDTYIRQVVNGIREQRPRIKASGVNSEADEQTAQALTGLCRHIEMQSDAGMCYDLATDFAVTMGIGYWRVTTDYVREDSFDQDIYLKPVYNPFSVYWDPNSQQPDGSDATRAMISEVMSKREYERQYPNADKEQFTLRGTGDSDPNWIMKDDIRIAEYFRVLKKEADLVMLSNGQARYGDELNMELMSRLGYSVVGTRKSYKRVVEWVKVGGQEVLERRNWIGRYIPIVPLYGVQVEVDGKRIRQGMVRFGKDPQRQINFWQSAMTESIALAPKAKWLMAEGQDEGRENEWAQANQSAKATLHYKQTDVEGQEAPPPQRLQPEPPPAGAIQAMMSASTNLQRVMGTYDPAVVEGGPKSGKAIRGEQMQGEQSNFHFYDNLTRSIRWTGMLILDLIPQIYDSQRVARIIGDDGKASLVTLNESVEDKILRDVRVGQYDVVMETGPGYATKRQESVEAMTQLFGNDPELMKIAGDLLFRNMDFPGAEVIADRLAAANPLAQIDEHSDIPPKVQMMIKQLQQQLQQAQQQLQAAGMEIKFKHGLEQMKQSAETNREHMRQVTKAHDAELRAETSIQDTQTRAATALSEAEIRAIAELLSHHIKASEAEKSLSRTAA